MEEMFKTSPDVHMQIALIIVFVIVCDFQLCPITERIYKKLKEYLDYLSKSEKLELEDGKVLLLLFSLFAREGENDAQFIQWGAAVISGEWFFEKNFVQASGIRQ